MIINYPDIGICGLSCKLCPRYNTESQSKCGGCKSDVRITVGCPFISCAIKKKGIEFCWGCKDSEICEKWKKHREFGKNHDSFKCYQKLEDNISIIKKDGLNEFIKEQKIRGELVKEMLEYFNEGRSKNYYCIAATVLNIDELKGAIAKAKRDSKGLDIKYRSKILHSLIDKIADKKKYYLKLRK